MGSIHGNENGTGAWSQTKSSLTVKIKVNQGTGEDIFTNYAPTLPFNWHDSNSVNFLRRFYRVKAGQ